MKDQKKLLFKCLNDDVPAFVICGTDAGAVGAIDGYMRLAKENGCDTDFLADLQLVRDEFVKYQAQEPDKVKIPD